MLNNKKIKLRYFEPEDIELIMRIRSDSSTYDFFYEYEPLNKEQQLSWWQQSFLKKDEKNFIIALSNNNEAIGTISLTNIDNRNRKAEFGRFFIYKDFLGKGYGKDSLNLIIEYAFNHMNLKKLYLEVFSENKVAIEVYKKNGFIEEGCLKSHIYKSGNYLDVLIMALIRE